MFLDCRKGARAQGTGRLASHMIRGPSPIVTGKTRARSVPKRCEVHHLCIQLLLAKTRNSDMKHDCLTKGLVAVLTGTCYLRPEAGRAWKA